MPTRRKILQSAAVLSAAPLAPRVVMAGAARPAAHLAALGDERHTESRAFRLRASRRDAPILMTRDGDITALWQGSLSATWKSKPLAIAGLTERPALFLLEQLGWQHGMRVFFHAEHERREDGLFQHRIMRSSRPGLGRQLEAAGSAWPAVLADQLLTTPAEVASKDITPTGAAMASQADEPNMLHSWIIAPKSAVELI